MRNSDVAVANCRGWSQRVFAGVAGLALAFAVSAPLAADAAETGMARLGDDYALFHIGGEDWHPCEHECNADASCKSWTYILTTGQCRLKHSIPRPMANNCCVTGVKEEVATAPRHDEDECARLANEAIEANAQNLRGRCGLAGPLWSSSYDHAYARCLESSPPRRTRDAADRQQALGLCQQTADASGKLVCDHYARMSVAENLTNTKNNCGFTGVGWTGDYGDHMRFCRDAERAKLSDQIAMREHQILECLGRGGAATDTDCQAFADRSVDQFVQARRLRCGDAFSGPGWSQDAGEHYRWCRSHDHAERDAMLERRQQALETCDQGRLDLRKIFKF